MAGKVLAVYDVRGIQDYIYKTPDVKDAIGASALVENLFGNALQKSHEILGGKYSFDIEWCDENGKERPFSMEECSDVTVLYIGGGNASVLYSSYEAYKEVNRIMSKYVINETYSLQLSAACVECSGNYSKDYTVVMTELNKAKAEMNYAKPLGALPIMNVEVKTGLPLSHKERDHERFLSYETAQKRREEFEKRWGTEGKKFDEYITEKGVDSTLAVVHIDGNNMGLRIRNMLNEITGYDEAVNRMRQISANISNAYTSAYDEMSKSFNREYENVKKFNNKENTRFVLKILTAGDDITYICNGLIAFDTVEEFCNRISAKTMNGETDADSMRLYGFSACAGIAFIGSHFPFSVGYEVAESCCDSAKDAAKARKAVYHVGGNTFENVGNWVDFQICKNIYAKNLERIREEEYTTPEGECLLIRPYYISVKNESVDLMPKEKWKMFDSFTENIRYFRSKENLPRNFAKQLRNIYPEGEKRVNEFSAFLRSREWHMPDQQDGMYYFDQKGKTAKWFDALEMLDYYLGIRDVACTSEQEK